MLSTAISIAYPAVGYCVAVDTNGKAIVYQRGARTKASKLMAIVLLRYEPPGVYPGAAAELQEVEQLSCPQCQAPNEQDSASCDQCGAALTGQAHPWDLADPFPPPTAQASPLADTFIPSTSASQYPRTPGEQFLPDNRAGQYIPGSDVPASQFRPAWRRLTRVEQTAGGATLIVLVSLFLPWFGFADLGTSVSGTGAHGYLVIEVLLAVLMTGYLLQRSGWEEFPFRLPVAPETVLIAGAGLQFVLVAIGFADVPMAGLSWQSGAYLALIAAAATLGAALMPVLRSRPSRRGPVETGDEP